MKQSKIKRILSLTILPLLLIAIMVTSGIAPAFSLSAAGGDANPQIDSPNKFIVELDYQILSANATFGFTSSSGAVLYFQVKNDVITPHVYGVGGGWQTSTNSITNQTIKAASWIHAKIVAEVLTDGTIKIDLYLSVGAAEEKVIDGAIYTTRTGGSGSTAVPFGTVGSFAFRQHGGDSALYDNIAFYDNTGVTPVELFKEDFQSGSSVYFDSQKTYREGQSTAIVYENGNMKLTGTIFNVSYPIVDFYNSNGELPIDPDNYTIYWDFKLDESYSGDKPNASASLRFASHGGSYLVWQFNVNNVESSRPNLPMFRPHRWGGGANPITQQPMSNAMPLEKAFNTWWRCKITVTLEDGKYYAQTWLQELNANKIPVGEWKEVYQKIDLNSDNTTKWNLGKIGLRSFFDGSNNDVTTYDNIEIYDTTTGTEVPMFIENFSSDNGFSTLFPTVQAPNYITGEWKVEKPASGNIEVESSKYIYEIKEWGVDKTDVNTGNIILNLPDITNNLTPNTTFENEKYSAVITWNDLEGNLIPKSTYTAQIKITPKDGYVLGNGGHDVNVSSLGIGFTVKSVNITNYGGDIFINIEYSVPAIKLPENITFDNLIPVTGQSIVKSLPNGTNYTASITWSKLDNIAAPVTVYIATITLTPDAISTWDNIPNVVITGVSSSKISAEKLNDKIILTVEFPQSGKKTGPGAPDAPSIKNITTRSISINTKNKMEYSLNGTVWQSSGIFADLTPNKEYTIYARIEATDDTLASDYTTITVSTLAVDIIGKVYIEGIGIIGYPIKANVSQIMLNDSQTQLGIITYQWYRDNVAIPGATGASYTITANDIGKIITVKVKSQGFISEVNSEVATVLDGNDTIDALKDIIKGLEKELASGDPKAIADEIEIVKDLIKDANNKILLLESIKSNLKDINDTVKSTYENIQTTYNALYNEYINFKNNENANVYDMLKQINTLNDEISTLISGDLEPSYKTQLISLKAQIIVLENAIASSGVAKKLELAELSSQIVALQNELAFLTSTSTFLSIDLETKIAAIAKLNSDIANMESTLSVLLANGDSEAAINMVNQIKTAKISLKTAEAELVAATAEAEENTKQVNALAAKMNALNVEIANVKEGPANSIAMSFFIIMLCVSAVGAIAITSIVCVVVAKKKA